ncbi:MAG TPA: hypothetical protein P5114_00310 [Hyphomicrobiaceae bacterium]|nr:hypothetical protein [Hyphomicrobiaceae bacterium]
MTNAANSALPRKLSFSERRSKAIAILSMAAVALLVAIYYSPVWWVSLTAPNYPAEAFPDGVRIQFHMNGVFNGCKLAAKRDVYEEKPLDCVHEMDAINHFVGMFPIASGGVIEKFFSPFLMSFLGVLIIGFAIPKPGLRVGIMGVGFVAIGAWMYLAYFTNGGLKYQNAGYVEAMVTSLGQGQEEEGEELSPIIATLKKSLIDSGESSVANREELRRSVEAVGQSKLGEALARLHQGTADDGGGDARGLKEILAEAERSKLTGKSLDINILKSAYGADRARGSSSAPVAWNGSGRQVLAWHYEKSLGRWFNEPVKNGAMARTVMQFANGLFWLILLAMAAMLFFARNNGRAHYLLIIVPVLLPVFFIIEYAAWLWWYGHSLNAMGAFTLKPFMPTVFGQGKVAQFATHSYPHRGFALMLVVALFSALVLLMRRKQLAEVGPGA